MGTEISELPTDYQKFIATSRYARWRDDLGRRESWEETVDRYIDYMRNKVETSTASEEDKKYMLEVLG